jgi:rhodanese-related sulfurtransferase
MVCGVEVRDMRHLSTALRVAVAAAALALAAGCGDEGAPADGLISPAEAAALISARAGDPDFVILDVRTSVEYAGDHIDGAVNIDYYDPGFESLIDALDRAKTYLVYCQSGNRSASAVAVMAGLGFVEVYELDGGITAWIAAGQPVVT